MLPPDQPPPPEPNPYEPPRTASERPKGRLRFIEVFDRVIMWSALAPLILMVSAVAFVVTCVPTGLMTMGLPGHGDPDGAQRGFVVACVVGLIAAVGTAYGLIQLINRAGRRKPP